MDENAELDLFRESSVKQSPGGIALEGIRFRARRTGNGQNRDGRRGVRLCRLRVGHSWQHRNSRSGGRQGQSCRPWRLHRTARIPHLTAKITLRFPYRRWRVWRSFPVHEQPSDSNTRNAHRLGASGRLRSARFSAVQFSGSSSNRPGCHGLNAPEKSHPKCVVTPRRSVGGASAAAPHDAPHPNSSQPKIPRDRDRPFSPPWPPSYRGER